MAEVTPERWNSLRERRIPHGFVHEPIAAELEDALLAIDQDGRLHLLVALTVEPLSLPPDLQSIEVRIREGAGIWLDVSARSHHEDLFSMLANKILYAIQVEGRDRATAVERTIEELRSALRPLALELSAEKQIGLFGELWVLSNILLPTIGGKACQVWSGPEGERHDFVGTGVHLEVKTTTRSEQKHEVSRLDQLRAPAEKRLLLASVLLERSILGDDTVADLIDEIVQKLGADGHGIDTFEGKLRKLNWSDDLRQSGSLLRFNLRQVHVFEVEGSFPRLPDDYEPPRGVTAVKYVIDLSARPSLNKAAVEEILRAM
jgi:hypothetical protein